MNDSLLVAIHQGESLFPFSELKTLNIRSTVFAGIES